MNFKRYQWKDATLQRKSKRYDNLMLVFAALALISAWLLQSMFTYVGIGLLAGAAVMLVLSWRIQNQDKRLKRDGSSRS